MAVSNFLVNTLPAYVEENRDLLIRNFALVGTDTRKRIGLQTGIKSKARLYDLTAGIVLQDGSTCGFNPLDTLTLANRDIEVAIVKHDGEICPETLLGKYGEWLVRIKATENDLPFEEYIVRVLTDEINKVIEKMIWQGDTSSADANLKWTDGFLAQFGDDADVIEADLTGVTSVYASLVQVYMAMPEEVLERGGVIFLAPALYRAFLQDLVSANLYHYAGPQDAAPEEFIIPGTDVKVIKTPGLIGSKTAVGTFADNLVYGTDGENDAEAIDIWWSADNRTFRYQVKFAAGVAYHYPDMIVTGDLSDIA